MYERGVLDAEQDDLNLFYYQHYYHYRKGYDRTRRRLKQPHSGSVLDSRFFILGALAGVVVLLVVLGTTLIQRFTTNELNNSQVVAGGAAPTVAPPPQRLPHPQLPRSLPLPPRLRLC